MAGKKTLQSDMEEYRALVKDFNWSPFKKEQVATRLANTHNPIFEARARKSDAADKREYLAKSKVMATKPKATTKTTQSSSASRSKANANKSRANGR